MPRQESQDNAEFAMFKLVNDWFRHLTLLSTATLVALVVFGVSLTPSAGWRMLLGLSLAAFALSVLGCVVAQYYLFLMQLSGTPLGRKGYVSAVMAISGFVVGVLSLCGYALANLFHS